MAFDGLLITEIFCSLQGETSLSGVPFTFVRLTGCNLRCSYCDSTYAFKGGTRQSLDEVTERVRKFYPKNVLVTGGEPLLQRNTAALCDRLADLGYTVSIETHGEVSIAPVAKRHRIIMDIKTPGSLMNRGQHVHNFPLLKSTDEIKFVITSKCDYHWAKDLILGGTLPACEILFSPVIGKQSDYELRWLAEAILADRLNVRLQTQLHKLIWGTETTGV